MRSHCTLYERPRSVALSNSSFVQKVESISFNHKQVLGLGSLAQKLHWVPRRECERRQP
jgi:hypothetical protein